MKTIATIFTLVNKLVWIIVAALVILLFSINIPALPTLGFQSYITTSPSMEPTIMTGDLIFIKSQPSYDLQDVITFEDEKNRTITHRIISITTEQDGSTNYITKGDNNRTEDLATVPESAILGKWQFTVPKIGYLLVALGKPLGLFVLFGIPISLSIIEVLIFKKPQPKEATEIQ